MKAVKINRITSVKFRRTKDNVPYIVIECYSRDLFGVIYWLGFYNSPKSKKLREGLGWFGFSGKIADLLSLHERQRAKSFTPPIKPVLVDSNGAFYQIKGFNYDEEKQK